MPNRSPARRTALAIGLTALAGAAAAVYFSPAVQLRLFERAARGADRAATAAIMHDVHDYHISPE
jgi:hypothetical protein